VTNGENSGVSTEAPTEAEIRKAMKKNNKWKSTRSR
jgi:hypothetical protein